MADIQITTTEKMNVVRLKGRLDIAGVQSIELQFSEVGRQPKNTIVNLCDVDFCASFGMRMLLSAAKKLDAAGKKFILVSPNESVLATLEIAGLTTIMPVYPDEAEAAKSI